MVLGAEAVCTRQRADFIDPSISQFDVDASTCMKSMFWSYPFGFPGRNAQDLTEFTMIHSTEEIRTLRASNLRIESS